MTHTCFTQENSISLATAFYTLSNQQCPLYPSGAWLLSSFAKEVTPQGLASENWPCISHVCIHYCSFLILCFFPSIKTLKDRSQLSEPHLLRDGVTSLCPAITLHPLLLCGTYPDKGSISVFLIQ